MFPGQIQYGVGVQPLQGQRLPQGLPAPVVVARGKLAAHAVRLLHRTYFFLGRDGHAAQGQSSGAHQVKGVLGGLAARRAGGEIEYRGHVALSQRLERAKQRRRGLSDAGGRFDHGVRMIPHGRVNRRGHVPLALPVGVEGKGQAVQRGPGSVLPIVHGGNPAQVGHGVGHQALFKLPGVVFLAVFPLSPVHAGIGQAHFSPLDAFVQAEQRRVDLPLRPMYGIVVFQNGRGVLRSSLDLEDAHAIPVDIHPVRPAVDAQYMALHGDVPGHGHLAAPCDRQQLLKRLMAAHPLAHARRRPPRRYQIALFKGEFRQRAHADRVYFLHSPLSFLLT